jgi:hypothetical protein
MKRWIQVILIVIIVLLLILLVTPLLVSVPPLTRPDPRFDFYDLHQPIYTRSRFLPPSRVDGCRPEREAAGG